MKEEGKQEAWPRAAFASASRPAARFGETGLAAPPLFTHPPSPILLYFTRRGVPKASQSILEALWALPLLAVAAVRELDGRGAQVSSGAPGARERCSESEVAACLETIRGR